jgi:V/A-type H+-transporting ATPase subunit D
MARNVKPTRRDYLDTQQKLERTQQGYELLEQKRQILVMELMAQMESAKRIKEEINTVMADAYSAQRDAAVRTGISGMMRQSAGIRMDHQLSYSSHSVMGVSVPEITCRPEAFGLKFGITDGRSPTDQVMRRFVDALELVARLAQVENAVFRLAREIKRTQRRVNALEKTYIPEYKEDLKYIESALAEKQREQFIVLRKAKQKRQQKAARRAAQAAERDEAGAIYESEEL